jgi:hypothetical protein
LYDPYRLYPIPPFLSPNDTDHQTLILIKWIPWTEDVSFNISIKKILVVTDVSARMREYYESGIQRAIEESIEEEFGRIEELQEPPLTSIEDESKGTEGNSIEELSELLNKLAKKTKKRVLH